MQENNQGAAGGVVVPSQTVADSEAKKKQQKRTLSQLPVYRAASNLLFVVAEIVNHGPKHMRKFFDLMLTKADDVLNAIGMADVSRTDEDRVWYINSALVMIQSERTYFIILQRLGIMPTTKRQPVHKKADGEELKAPKIEYADRMSKDLANKVDALLKSITAQLVAWRDNPRGEGVPSFMK